MKDLKKWKYSNHWQRYVKGFNLNISVNPPVEFVISGYSMKCFPRVFPSVSITTDLVPPVPTLSSAGSQVAPPHFSTCPVLGAVFDKGLPKSFCTVGLG